MDVQRPLHLELAIAIVAIVVPLGACHHARPGHGAGATARTRATAVTLFTDGAFVEQAIDVEVGDQPAVIHASLPYDVDPQDVVVVERARLELGPIRTAIPEHELAPPVAETSNDTDVDATADSVGDLPIPTGIYTMARPGMPRVPEPSLDPPRAFEVVVRGPRGHHLVHLAYHTTAMVFAAAYTVTTTPARDRATLRGALSITNITNVALPHAEISLVDGTTEDWRAHQRDGLVARLGGPEPGPVHLVRRPLGTVDLANGITRIELVPDATSRPMRSVLVYDPFGTQLDNATPIPRTEPELGVHAPGIVTESFEIARSTATGDGLPAGTVRLLEARRDGSVAVLGESRIFDAASRTAKVDTIPVGTAEGVTAHRERVELTVDEDLHRVIEELAIEIVNTRPAAIDVVLREHAYRGPTWTLAYHSTDNVAQEGTQQFAMRAHVRANAKVRTSHVVVYRW